MKIENKIHEYRSIQNKSLQDVATIANITKTQVHDLEHGRCQPKLFTARGIALALGCNVNDLWPFNRDDVIEGLNLG